MQKAEGSGLSGFEKDRKGRWMRLRLRLMDVHLTYQSQRGFTNKFLTVNSKYVHSVFLRFCTPFELLEFIH